VKILTKLAISCLLTIGSSSMMLAAIRIAYSDSVTNKQAVVPKEQAAERLDDVLNDPKKHRQYIADHFGQAQEYTVQRSIEILRDYFSKQKIQRAEEDDKQVFWAMHSLGNKMMHELSRLDQMAVQIIAQKEEQRLATLSVDDLKGEFIDKVDQLVKQSNESPVDKSNQEDKKKLLEWTLRVAESAKTVLKRDDSLRSFIDSTIQDKLSQVQGLSDSERQSTFDRSQKIIDFVIQQNAENH